MRAVVVGAGWAGVAAAWRLTQAGAEVEVLEAAPVIGGHSRSEELCGVVFEAEGPHVFHTDDQDVMRWLMDLGMEETWRQYRICPLSEIDLGEHGSRMMSWPIQLGELRDLPCWKQIEAELDALPPRPGGADLESWCVSLMGRTLYELFIEGYTRKQWGCEPHELSAAIGPKRIDLRRYGHRPLHANRWQFYATQGPTGVMDRALDASTVSVGAHATAGLLAEVNFDGAVVTAALDEFLGEAPLPWRGIALRSTFHPEAGAGTVTPGHVVKRPSPRVPYTRTIESKHATGQTCDGSVVSYEYPGAPARHYPVPTPDGAAERRNRELQERAAGAVGRPTVFAGRLATYRYIDMDEAIRSGWRAAEELLDQCADRFRMPPMPPAIPRRAPTASVAPR